MCEESPLTEGVMTKKELAGDAEPVSAGMRMLLPGEARMSLTGENEEPVWVPDT